MVDVGVAEDDGVEFGGVEGEAAVALAGLVARAAVQPAVQQDTMAARVEQVHGPGDAASGPPERDRRFGDFRTVNLHVSIVAPPGKGGAPRQGGKSGKPPGLPHPTRLPRLVGWVESSRPTTSPRPPWWVSKTRPTLQLAGPTGAEGVTVSAAPVPIE